MAPTVLSIATHQYTDPLVLADQDFGTSRQLVGATASFHQATIASKTKIRSQAKRQGGLVVFEEADTTMCPGFIEELPAHERGLEILGAMLAQEGVDRSIGFRLPEIFSKAGLRFEKIWADAIIDGQGDQFTLGELLELLKSRIEAAKVATTLEVEPLIQGIKSEVQPNTVVVTGMRFCAKSTKA